MKKRTQKRRPASRMPRREWESYTLDDIEEVIAFYLGSKTTPESIQDLALSQPDLAIFSVSPEGKFTDISRAGVNMLGYASKEEILNSKARSLFFNGSDAEKLKRIMERHGHVKDCEILIQKKNGELLHVLFTGRAIRDETEKICAYRGILRDITHQKQIEAFTEAIETLVAERTMSLMAMAVADKVRNPATIIAWLCKKMMEKEMPADLQESVSGIMTEAAKLEAIVKEFQGILSDRRSIFTYEDANDVLRSIMTLSEKEVDRKGIKLFCDISEKPLKINMQKDLWRVALLQVIRNAIEATPSVGEIVIRTYTENDNVIISVSDTGRGIPDDEVDKIFDPFYTTKLHRYGMGLPLVKQIISEHMGTIQVESNKDYGTTFRLVFPPRWRQQSNFQG